MFQQNELEDVRTNITVWLTSMAIQVNKLKKLNHVLDDKYHITHILASLPREYSSVVEQVKIDRRTSSALITMDEVKKRLKEHYLQLKREHGWSEDEMALNVKSGINQNKNIKKGSKGKYFKEGATIEENLGTRRLIVKKRLKEHYLQLKREHGWSEDEMALNVKSGINQNKNIKKGSKGKYFKEGATIEENLGTRRLIVGT